MSFVRAGQLARPTPTARPDDPLGLVAENLRESSYGAIPVIDGIFSGEHGLPGEGEYGRVLGLVDERDLAHPVLPILAHQETQRQLAAAYAAEVAAAEAAVARRVGAPVPDPMPAGATYAGSTAPNGFSSGFDGSTAPVNGSYAANGAASENGAAPATGFSGANGAMSPFNGYGAPAAPAVPVEAGPSVTDLTARDVMRTEIGIVPAAFSLHNALLTLDRYGSLALPVLDERGRYRGMISRADVVAALGNQVRPPMVGGMATPLGVWLTTGDVSGGASLLGLYLSGVILALCHVLATVVIYFALHSLNPEWGYMFTSGRVGVGADASNLFNFVVTAAQGLLFLLFIRALPLAGIHAAEHQTVWAIERGLPLIPAVVAKMPRAHPRCGTNLMALAGLIVIVFQHLPDFNPSKVLLALLFIYLMWRNFGELLQVWLTTRPASRRQLESGIKAGQELLAKYQNQPQVEVSFGRRIFNTGLVVALLGMVTVMLVIMGLSYLVTTDILQVGMRSV